VYPAINGSQQSPFKEGFGGGLKEAILALDQGLEG
jgi:hypothetical protein